MRLIDADALKKSIEELKRSPWFNSVLNPAWHAGIKEAVEVVEHLCIDKAPTIDAASIRRGTWSEEYDPNDDVFFRRKFRCSACNGWNTYGFTKYCPDCGAKMENAREYDAEKE